MKILITGGLGFLGSNLASYCLENSIETIVLDNFSRLGSESNLEWLNSKAQKKQLKVFRGDVRNQADVEEIVSSEKPDAIFHVAGQVAMTTSIARPRLDFETNVLGSYNVLEAIRKFSPKTTVIYSSTNKVYGDLEEFNYGVTDSRYTLSDFPNGLDENTRLDFRTPYGCSKGAADQYMRDYARCFDLKTIVFRHSSIFGGRQFSTFDQGWIGWFVDRAIKTKNKELEEPFTISGSGKQVRDVLFSQDLIQCYFGALEKSEELAGEVFNIGGGFDNSLSILELFSTLEKELDVNLEYKKLAVRKSDQKVFIADISKAEKLFKWKPKVDKLSGLKEMISWVKKIN